MPPGSLMTLLLLSPIFGFSAWLYWFLLRRNGLWAGTDRWILVGTGLFSAAIIVWVHAQNFDGDGTLWPPVLAAVAGYKAFIIPLTLIAVLRFARSRPAI